MPKEMPRVICRASHSAVGFRVTPNHKNCRRPWPKIRNANRSSKVTVGTMHMSMAAIPSALFCRKVFQVSRRWIRRSHHVFWDRRLGDFKPEHQELAMSSRGAPQCVLPTFSLHQVTQTTIYLWPPCPVSGFPTPENFQASAMPSQMFSGITTRAMPSRPGQSLVSHISSVRSLPRSRKREGARRKATLS